MKKLTSGLSLTLIMLLCAAPSFAQKKGGGGGGTPPAPFDPAVVYVQYNSKYTYDLMLMNAEGTQTKMLLAGTATAKHGAPSFSPDGSMVVFRSAIQGPGLYVMATNGLTPPQKLISVNRDHRYMTMPAWSPDGRYIVFSDWSGQLMDGTNREAWDLFVVEMIGGQAVPGSLRNLTNTSATSEYAPSWSPDGTRLVAHWEDPYEIQEFVFHFSPGDSSVPPALTSWYSITAHLGRMAIFSSRPQWSKHADGTQRVVFSGRLMTDTLMGDLWAIDVDAYLGSGSRRIVATADHEAYPAFSPDDSTILYEWNRSVGKGSTLTLVTNAQALLNGSESVPVTTETVARASSKVVSVQEPDWRR